MNRLIKLVKFGTFLALFGTIAAVTSLAAAYYYLKSDLPSVETLKDIRLQVPLRIFSRDHRLIAEFGEKRRVPLSYGEVPDQMILAFLAAEDDRFFKHPGVDYKGILRAVVKLIKSGHRRQGGSTITMQVARNFFLTSERTYTRKLKEIFLALRIEQKLEKQDIFELYLNKIYLGHRAYGVGAAAQVYYGKRIEELSLAEIAMIAGLPKAPSSYNPLANPERALMRRNYILGRMAKLDFISSNESKAAILAPVTAALHALTPEVEAPYLAEMVRAELVERFGSEAYTQGYQVYTTLDSRLQAAANVALQKALIAYDRRHGFRGVKQHLDLAETSTEQGWDEFLADQKTVGGLQPGLVTDVLEHSVTVYLGSTESIEIDWDGLKWARPYIDENRREPVPDNAGEILAAGDLIRVQSIAKDGDDPSWRLAQIPAVEGALVSIEPKDGALVALVGGFDFYNSKFNRVTQAKRQPGSGFKPVIYSAALDEGYTAASLINDAPVVFDDPSLEAAWRPENYSGKFFGPTRLRFALTKSRNLVSIRLLRAIGVQRALQQAEKFGFDASKLPRNLSLALGSGAVTLLQMASNYSVLANGGFQIKPYFIEHIEDGQRNTILRAAPLRVCSNCDLAKKTEDDGAQVKGLAENLAPRVISPENHFLMNSMMRDVIKRGTGRKARSLGRNDLAGKTGTTNDQRDAWFNGFHPDLVAVIWVGFDSFKPLGKGEVGGKAALPAWIDYMKVALKNRPEHPLEMPPGMVTVRIDPETGQRAGVDQKSAIFEHFRAANVPKELPASAITSPDGGPIVAPKEEQAEIF
ncbi:Multimodular transpeptidase-transglycosylase [hydrothermal vent metagenome]|uniref:Penicillin-binding protein 1A n=1 Tax=hydrothermal vent metagenome TaxID=652676 RepID=A0A3B1AWJ4_9ZZZZ